MIETTMPRRNTEIIPFPAPEAGPGTQQAQPYCLITGAGRGLGLALAEECAGLGMNLILVDLPNTGLPDVTAHLARRYGVAAMCRHFPQHLTRYMLVTRVCFCCDIRP